MAIKENEICNQIKWIDITEPSTQEIETISTQYKLHYQLMRDSMEPDHLPKFDLVDEVNFIILRYYHQAQDKRAATIQELSNKIAIFFTGDFLISIHKEPIHFLNTIQRKYVEKGKCTTAENLLTHILLFSLETFADPAQRLTEQIDFFENQILLKSVSNAQVEALYYIKRQASMSNKILMLMAEPINHIRTLPEDDPSLQDVKDQHLKMMTLYSQILEDVNNLMNLYMSFSAQKTNDVMKILTIFSVFFMPLTFIVGIYGMNFRFMPELNQAWGYPAVLFVMAAITAIIYFWFRKKEWL